MNIYIKPKSILAFIASKILKSKNMAIVVGKTIYLYGLTESEFLHNKTHVAHEICHVQQYKQHGFVIFIIKYLVESIKHGYTNNIFEIEARKAETLSLPKFNVIKHA
jgi:hypothetical protein